VNINASRDEFIALLTDILGSGVATRVQQAALNRPNVQFSSLLDFYLNSTLSEEEFMKIETEITTENGAMLPGKVNVNTASVAVLTCIPGIGEDKAQELVSYRQSNSSAVNSMAWVTKVLSRDQVLDAGPFITGQSYQFSADIAAVGKLGRGYRRTKFVFDTTEGTPKIVYRQNLSHLGWALGADVRDNWLAKANQ
jgi:DNA uptake protein ComE-like DNA-binding protein